MLAILLFAWTLCPFARALDWDSDLNYLFTDLYSKAFLQPFRLCMLAVEQSHPLYHSCVEFTNEVSCRCSFLKVVDRECGELGVVSGTYWFFENSMRAVCVRAREVLETAEVQGVVQTIEAHPTPVEEQGPLAKRASPPLKDLASRSNQASAHHPRSKPLPESQWNSHLDQENIAPVPVVSRGTRPLLAPSLQSDPYLGYVKPLRPLVAPSGYSNQVVYAMTVDCEKAEAKKRKAMAEGAGTRYDEIRGRPKPETQGSHPFLSNAPYPTPPIPTFHTVFTTGLIIDLPLSMETSVGVAGGSGK